MYIYGYTFFHFSLPPTNGSNYSMGLVHARFTRPLITFVFNCVPRSKQNHGGPKTVSRDIYIYVCVYTYICVYVYIYNPRIPDLYIYILSIYIYTHAYADIHHINTRPWNAWCSCKPLSKITKAPGEQRSCKAIGAIQPPCATRCWINGFIWLRNKPLCGVGGMRYRLCLEILMWKNQMPVATTCMRHERLDQEIALANSVWVKSWGKESHLGPVQPAKTCPMVMVLSVSPLLGSASKRLSLWRACALLVLHGSGLPNPWIHNVPNLGIVAHGFLKLFV